MGIVLTSAICGGCINESATISTSAFGLVYKYQMYLLHPKS